jgi:hypothetical protein
MASEEDADGSLKLRSLEKAISILLASPLS